MRFPLMAWNRNTLNGLLAHDRDGRACHRHALISVARQNAKTTMGQALAGWWLTDHAREHGPQTVTWTAHDLRLAEATFFSLARQLDEQVERSTSSYGRQRLVLRDGSEFHIQAATLGAGHGLSIDLAVVDEVWKVRPDIVEHGLIPAQRARRDPLLVMMSTAGDESSTLMRAWRERALTLVETGTPGRLYFAEWSPPPGVDYADPSWWPWANPALGTTIDADTLRDEWNGPNRNAFLRASLNLWVQSDVAWLPPGAWDQLALPRLPSPARGVVACELSQGGERFYALRAWQHNGITHVRPVIASEREQDLWTAVGELDCETVLVTPPLELRLPPALTRRARTVGIRELARATPAVSAMIAAGQVCHDGSRLLAEHVGRAVAVRQAGLSTAHSSGSIELARCLVWAVAQSARPGHDRRPALALART